MSISTLVMASGAHRNKGPLADQPAAFGDGEPLGSVLGGDVDHACLAARIDMGQLCMTPDRHALELWRGRLRRTWPRKGFFALLTDSLCCGAARFAREHGVSCRGNVALPH